MSRWPALACPRCHASLEEEGAEADVPECSACGLGFPAVDGVRFLADPATQHAVATWQKTIYDAMPHQRYGGWKLGRGPDITLTYWSHSRHIAALRPAVGETVLDVGCLDGRRLFEILASFDVLGVGVDLSTVATGVARAARHPRARFHAASAEALPLADASVDVAVAMDVLEHLAAPGAAINEVRRCLRPGGRFLAHVPVTDNEGSWDAWMAAHRREEWIQGARAVGHDYAAMPGSADLKRWFEVAGFVDVRLERFNAWHQNRFDYHHVHRVLNTLFFVLDLPIGLYHDFVSYGTRLWCVLDTPRIARGVGGSVYVSGCIARTASAVDRPAPVHGTSR